MLSIKLAWRNLIGAGLRTWLNVIILSLSFVIIIWHKGLLDGWHEQARNDMIDWEIAGGQYWQTNYDPYDVFTLEDSHAPLAESSSKLIESGVLCPILITQATIYPDGRMQSILLKGIDKRQKLLKMPAQKLDVQIQEIPAIIGTRLAKSTKLKEGDFMTIRWRDVNGAFDATEVKIVGIFKANVPTVDAGQIWIPLARLQEMMQMPNEATMVVVQNKNEIAIASNDWTFKSENDLMKTIDDLIAQKQVGGSIFYIILMFLALLAIFDTQVLSVFRRQKEIGTHMALGMTRVQVIKLFTIEGSMHAVFAAVVAAIYGIPLLYWQASTGFSLPEGTDDYGFAVAEKIFPTYSLGLIASTTLIILLAATIVSFLPAKKIAKMNTTDAIKGKIN